MTQAAEIETTKNVQSFTVLERCVCMLLKCGYIGNTRKVDLRSMKLQKDGEDLEREKRRTHMSKQLVASAHLRPCAATIDAAKAFLRSISTPGHKIFGAGTYLIPKAFVLEAEQRLKQYAEDLEAHAQALSAKWSDVVEESRQELGKLFDAQEFPTAQDVLDEYRLEWSYMAFGAPNLMEIDQALYEAEQEKHQRMLQQAADEIVANLQEASLKVFTELANRLRPGVGGKQKALHPSALDDLQELLTRLPVLNVTGNTELASIVTSCGALADGLDVETVRASRGVRAMLLEKAESAITQLDALVVGSGRRAMAL